MNTFFTAWGYEVSYLEFASVLTSLTAVTLGARGTRWAWPWWILGSSLYGLFFFNVDLLASALLQIVFIAAAI
jgi:nicotinamide mononucleotide transporter